MEKPSSTPATEHRPAGAAAPKKLLSCHEPATEAAPRQMQSCHGQAKAGPSEPKPAAKGEQPKRNQHALAGPPVPGWPTLAGPIPKEGVGKSPEGKAGQSAPAPKTAPAKTTSCTATHYPDPSAPRIPIVRGKDGKPKFDVGPLPGGTAPVAGSKSKAPTHRDRADGIHSWVNEAASKGAFDRTNGVQDQEGFTAFLGEFDPSKMKYSDYHAKYQEYLAGHMPGKIAGQSLLGTGLLPTAVPPVGPKATPVEAGKGVKLMPIAESRTAHIFRNTEGHLLDTPANRKLLFEVASDKSRMIGTDKFGNSWAACVRPDGIQVWTQSRNGEIINGGVNQTPRVYNPQTGLANPELPGR